MRIRHPLILASVCLGYFMAVLDSTVVNVALPDMARSLGTGIAGMQWAVGGYARLFAGLMLMAVGGGVGLGCGAASCSWRGRWAIGGATRRRSPRAWGSSRSRRVCAASRPIW